jgi:hypothetical protein
MRIALGLVAATSATPVAIAILFGALSGLQLDWFAGKSWPETIDTMVLYGTFSAPVALFMTIAVGSPLAHRLAQLGHRRLAYHAMVGMILGAVPFALFDGYIIGTNFLLDVRPAPNFDTVLAAARWAALGSWCGLWSACAYWLVVIRRRVSTP